MNLDAIDDFFIDKVTASSYAQKAIKNVLETSLECQSWSPGSPTNATVAPSSPHFSSALPDFHGSVMCGNCGKHALEHDGAKKSRGGKGGGGTKGAAAGGKKVGGGVGVQRWVAQVHAAEALLRHRQWVELPNAPDRSSPARTPLSCLAPLQPRPVLPNEAPRARRLDTLTADVVDLIRRAAAISTKSDERKVLSSMASHLSQLPSVADGVGWSDGASSLPVAPSRDSSSSRHASLATRLKEVDRSLRRARHQLLTMATGSDANARSSAAPKLAPIVRNGLGTGTSTLGDGQRGRLSARKQADPASDDDGEADEDSEGALSTSDLLLGLLDLHRARKFDLVQASLRNVSDSVRREFKELLEVDRERRGKKGKSSSSSSSSSSSKSRSTRSSGDDSDAA